MKIKLILPALAALLSFQSPLSAQNISVSKISEDAGINTDRRPVTVGFYDSTSNKTLLSWMGAYSHPVIKVFDHTSQTWSSDKTVGRSPFADSHNYPALVRTKEGSVLIFYGCHNSTLRLTSSPLESAVEDSWDDRYIEEAPGASYPFPIVTKDGAIYCFYRITMKTVYPDSGYPTDYRPLGFIKSTDNGESWSSANIFLDTYPREDNLCEIYNGKISYQAGSDSVSERIHLAWSLSGGGPNNHDHGLYRRHIYYAYMEVENEHFFDIRGNDLGKNINNQEAETYCKVADTGTPPNGDMVGYQPSVHYMDNGKPLIIYRHDGFKSARWENGEWHISTIYASGNEPRDIEKVGNKTFRTYRTSGRSVYVFKTIDGGASWQQEDKITIEEKVKRCYVVDNYHEQIKYLLSENKDDGNNVEAGSRDIFIGGLAEITALRSNRLKESHTIFDVQNYPNPFNPNTTIRYRLQEKSRVEIAVYDIHGRLIMTLQNSEQSPGPKSIRFDGSMLPSGIYFYKIKTRKDAALNKMILLK